MYPTNMTQRTHDDYTHERQALDAAHAQNEAGRDAFVALAHTALFAASVSFVGDVAPLTEAIWKPLLIGGWSTDVVGLLALTFSFSAARRSIDARRAALNDPNPPSSFIAELLNGIALWSFPVALLCLFSFVTANVVHSDGRKIQPTARHIRSDTARSSPKLRDQGSGATAQSAEPRRAVDTVDRHCSGAAGTVGSASRSAATSAKEVAVKGH